MTTKRFTMFVIVMAACVLFVGCKKEKGNESVEQQSYSKPMLKFESFKEVLDYLSNTDTKTSNTDFISYGSMADKEYYSLDIENRFPTLESIQQFVSDNREKYQLILLPEGDYMFESRYYDHPYRNVANTDGIFQVGNNVYKIIEGGLAYSSVSNTTDLVKFKNYEKEPENICMFMFDDVTESSTSTNSKLLPNPDPCSQNCSSEYDDYEPKDGTNRIRLKLTRIATPPNSPETWSTVGMEYFAKPYHKTVFWFGCFRTISGYFDATVHYWKSDYGNPHAYGWFAYHPTATSFTKSGSSHTITKVMNPNLYLYPSQTTPNVHFGQVDCWASTPDPGCRIEFKCNN